jgi:non-homologous end joining protein Ku
MAARANWKGYLRLSLVSCPVALFPATTESEKIRTAGLAAAAECGEPGGFKSAIGAREP